MVDGREGLIFSLGCCIISLDTVSDGEEYDFPLSTERKLAMKRKKEKTREKTKKVLKSAKKKMV